MHRHTQLYRVNHTLFRKKTFTHITRPFKLQKRNRSTLYVFSLFRKNKSQIGSVLFGKNTIQNQIIKIRIMFCTNFRILFISHMHDF